MLANKRTQTRREANVILTNNTHTHTHTHDRGATHQAHGPHVALPDLIAHLRHCLVVRGQLPQRLVKSPAAQQQRLADLDVGAGLPQAVELG